MSDYDLRVVDEPAPPAAPAVPEPEKKHVVLSLENVSKRFCRDLKRSLLYGVQDIAREVVGRSQHPDTLRKDEFWAVKGVNMELRSGDALGIVGINGCGKTSLMRIVAGLIKPTTGKVTVRGRLAPLLALGAGFNPILTGRENIFANMSILGLTYEEIQDRFDDVVAFSEIGYAIDAPVQTYSSGMTARLGFSCAISTQPDILLLDEVLAVGDMNFRRKCLERLFEMRANGMSLVMVHHSPGILLSIAETALYLRKGQAVDFGEIGPVIQKYERDLVKDMPSSGDAGQVAADGEMTSSSDGELIDVTVESNVPNAMTSGKDAMIRAHFKILRPIAQVNFTATIYRLPSLESIKSDEKPRQVVKMVSRRDGGSISNVQPGEYEVRIQLSAVGLRDGIYQIGLRMSCPPRIVLASRSSTSFLVSSDDVTPGEYHQNRVWSVVSKDGSQLRTERFLNSVETADDLLDLEHKEDGL